jgi:hypothetical protein
MATQPTFDWDGIFLASAALGKSGTDGTFSDISLTWFALIQKDGETSRLSPAPRRRRRERLLQKRDEQEKSKVKGPTRETDVWATQFRMGIYRPGHPPKSVEEIKSGIPLRSRTGSYS